MSKNSFQFGDRVKHCLKPEWGIGSVVRVEAISVSGEGFQRVSVRFPNAGLKVLSTNIATLETVSAPATNGQVDSQPENKISWDQIDSNGWLASIERKKIEQTMTSLPDEVRDPFIELTRRLSQMLDLYRFEISGGSLIDWAVAQSGLDDPLTRFSRQELERLFQRWECERDQQLNRLLQDVRQTRTDVENLLASAPHAGREAAHRIIKQR